MATLLFLLFSPVLVPAAAAISMAVAGVLVAGMFGLAGLMAFSWVVNSLVENTPFNDGKNGALMTVQRTVIAPAVIKGEFLTTVVNRR